jgi:flagellar L-ring protein precursor FlgH
MFWHSRTTAIVLSIAAVCSSSRPALAQRSSLIERNEQGAVPLATTSLTYREVLPPRKIQLHDLITIVVIESSQSLNSGEFDGRKNALINAQLKDWVELDGLNLKAAPQENGDPRANGTYNTQYRAEGELETQQALKFTITAEVVDIRPNGVLVLEATKRVQHDDDIWEASVIGMVRPEDIDPRNRVTSDALAMPKITLRSAGHVRDSYRRGWLHKLYDRLAPFEEVGGATGMHRGDRGTQREIGGCRRSGDSADGSRSGHAQVER